MGGLLLSRIIFVALSSTKRLLFLPFFKDIVIVSARLRLTRRSYHFGPFYSPCGW